MCKPLINTTFELQTEVVDIGLLGVHDGQFPCYALIYIYPQTVSMAFLGNLIWANNAIMKVSRTFFLKWHPS